MSKRITIPRLGSPRVDHELVKKVIEIRAKQIGDVSFVTTRRGRSARVERRSDADLYQRMMEAKGLPVRLGAYGGE